MTETIAAGQAQGEVPEEQPATVADLRRTGIHPDFWYPVAVSASVRKKWSGSIVRVSSLRARSSGSTGSFISAKTSDMPGSLSVSSTSASMSAVVVSTSVIGSTATRIPESSRRPHWPFQCQSSPASPAPPRRFERQKPKLSRLCQIGFLRQGIVVSFLVCLVVALGAALAGASRLAVWVREA